MQGAVNSIDTATPSTPPSKPRKIVRSPYFRKSNGKRRTRQHAENVGHGHSHSDAVSPGIPSCYFKHSSSGKLTANSTVTEVSARLLPWYDGAEFEDALPLFGVAGGERSANDQVDIALAHFTLLHDAAFSHFCSDFMRAYRGLYDAKPILIQEYVAHDPWKLLVAVTLLNKTAGTHAVPVFLELMDAWATAHALAQVPQGVLQARIAHLGLGRSRSERLIALSQAYCADPPVRGVMRTSRCYLDVGDGVKRQRYPPTEASHLPGSGPYALDSYRIFCAGEDEWKAVMPRDKELVRYL
ncbi:predicted protein, partial [Postia placenta Mad-698-R]